MPQTSTHRPPVRFTALVVALLALAVAVAGLAPRSAGAAPLHNITVSITKMVVYEDGDGGLGGCGEAALWLKTPAGTSAFITRNGSDYEMTACKGSSYDMPYSVPTKGHAVGNVRKFAGAPGQSFVADFGDPASAECDFISCMDLVGKKTITVPNPGTRTEFTIWVTGTNGGVSDKFLVAIKGSVKTY